MSITVVGPDGVELEFPDGTPRETMKAAMAKRYGAPKPTQAPQPQRPMSMIEGAINNLKGAREGLDRFLGGAARLEYITKGTGRGEHPERIDVNNPLFVLESWGNYRSPEAYKQRLIEKAAMVKPQINKWEKASYGYKPQATWEKAKANPISGGLGYIGEQAVVGLPTMIAAGVNPGAYALSLTGEMAQNRAQNDARPDANLGDLAISLPSAAGQAALERLGISKMLPGSGQAVRTLGGAALNIGKAAVTEAGTEGLQTGLQSLTETLGTRRGFDPWQTGDDIAAAMVAGAGIGGGVRATTAGPEIAANRFRVPDVAPMPTLEDIATQTAFASEVPAVPRPAGWRGGRGNIPRRPVAATQGPAPAGAPILDPVEPVAAPVTAPAGKVRRHEGIDYPVEVIGPPVMDASTGQMMARVRAEIGAEGFVPAEEVMDAQQAQPGPEQAAQAPPLPPSPAGPPRLAGGNGGGSPPAPPGTAAPGLPQPGNGNPPRLTDAEAKATRKILQLAKAAGVDPQDILSDRDFLPAQMLGRGGEGLLKATSRRPGTTGEMLDVKIDQFDAALPRKFQGIVEDGTGIDRDFIEMNHDSVIKKAQTTARPFFDEFEQLDLGTSPELDSLFQAPQGRRTLSGALTNAGNARRPTHEIQALTQLMEGLPTDQGPTGDAVSLEPLADEYLKASGARKALNRTRGPTITQWLADNRGLADKDGDVASLDGHLAHRDIPFRRKLVRPDGWSTDDAAVAAWTEGYFPDLQVPPEPGVLLETIRKDLAGQKVYARGGTEAQQLADRLDDFERRLARYEIDPTGKTAKQIAKELADEEAMIASLQDLDENGTASMEPSVQLTNRAVPTPRVLYDVKRFADADKVKRDLKAERDGPDPLDHDMDVWYADFREALGELVRGQGFDWDNLLRVGGEAPRIRAAHRDGHALIEGSDIDALKRQTRDWSDLEKHAAVAGFVNKILKDATGKQRITPRQMKLYGSPDFARRMAYMLNSDEKAKAWQGGMLRLAKQAEIRRLRGGSDTFDKLQGNAELDEMEQGFDLRKIPKNTEGVLNLALDQGNKVIDRWNAGWHADTRNALGQQLMDHDALRRGIEGLPDYQRERSLGNRISGIVRRVAPPRRGESGPPRRGRSGPPRHNNP